MSLGLTGFGLSGLGLTGLGLTGGPAVLFVTAFVAGFVAEVSRFVEEASGFVIVDSCAVASVFVMVDSGEDNKEQNGRELLLLLDARKEKTMG